MALVSVSLLPLLLLLHLGTAAPSQRGKCALECYSKCMFAGKKSAVYCNCPVQKNFLNCDEIEQRLNTAPIGTLAFADTHMQYLDAHSIKVRIPAVESAFIYVFEYATISTAPDQWLFAGASSSPSISFTVMDPCRDYQFRVLAIIRPINPGDNDVVLFRAMKIPVQLPPFVLHPDQISVEAPIWNATEEQVKVYVRWSLPRGYSDSDVYGYEAPAIYPIHCERVPEEELPTPKIEIVRNGGRLAVWLPSTIMDDQCRLWVEVHMLPRCVRLEPFSVQKPIEIDCERTPELDACQHASADQMPECTDVIDVWGSRGEATVMWQQPKRRPLSYSIRFGQATVQDAAPLVSWKLSTPKVLQVEGNKTSIVLRLDENVDYGIQVCAIFSDSRPPKYDLVKVTPLVCKSCPDGKKRRKCGECTKVEFPNNVEDDSAEDAEEVEDEELLRRPGSSLSRQDMEREMFEEQENMKEKGRNSSGAAQQVKNHKPERPIQFSGDSIKKLRDEESEQRRHLQQEATHLASTPASTDDFDSTTFDEILTTLSEEGQDLFEAPALGRGVGTVEVQDTTKEREGGHKGGQPRPITVEGESFAASRPKIVHVSESLFEPRVVAKSSTIVAVDTTTAVLSTTTTVPSSTTTTPSREAKKPIQKTSMNEAEECFLSNGVRCTQGCDFPSARSRSGHEERCVCAPPLIAAASGACHEAKPSCIHSSQLNATYDPSTMTVMITDSGLDPAANRLFVDIGTVSGKAPPKFIEPKKIRQRTEIPIQPDRPDGLSHIVRVNQMLSQNIDYGVRVCQFRAGAINAMTHVWEEQGEDTIVLVNKLASTGSATKEKEMPPKYDNYWSAFFTIGKIAILVALVLIMAVLVYLNCTKLKTFYERKRTHYFRPFVIDSGRTVGSRYPGGLPRTNPDLISYPQRNRSGL